MGSKSAPAAPDYTAAAQTQAAASQQNTQQQTTANRPNLYTPWGSETWSSQAGTDPSTGDPVTNWSANINLTPAQQQALNSQQGIQQGLSQGAQTLIGQATSSFQNPADWNSLPAQAGNVSAPTGYQNYSGINPNVPNSTIGGAGNIQGSLGPNSAQLQQQAQNATWQLQQPYLQQQTQALQTQLANQGITPGSQAYNLAMMQNNDSVNRAQLMSVQAGQQEAQQLFNQNLGAGQFANQAQQQQFSQNQAQAQFGNTAAQQQYQNQMQQNSYQNQLLQQEMQNQISSGSFNDQNRQQAISEMMQQRSQPLNELNALLYGQQVQNPSMPSFAQAGSAETPQLLNAAGMQYQSGLDASNAANGLFGSSMGGLFSLGSAAMNNGGWGSLFSMGGS